MRKRIVEDILPDGSKVYRIQKRVFCFWLNLDSDMWHSPVPHLYSSFEEVKQALDGSNSQRGMVVYTA